MPRKLLSKKKLRLPPGLLLGRFGQGWVFTGWFQPIWPGPVFHCGTALFFPSSGIPGPIGTKAKIGQLILQWYEP